MVRFFLVMYLVNRTMARPLVSRICSLKSLSVMLWSSLACGSPIESSIRTGTVTFDKSCPVTDEATGADAFGRNLGMPNSLNESFAARNDTKTRRSATWGILDNILNNCVLCWSWLLEMRNALKWRCHLLCRPLLEVDPKQSQIPVVGTTWVMSLNPRSTSFKSVKWVVQLSEGGPPLFRVLEKHGLTIRYTLLHSTLHGVPIHLYMRDFDVSHGNLSQY